MNCRDISRGVESRSRENSSWIWELLGDGGKSGKSGELQGGEGSYRSDLKLFRTGNTPASGSRVVRFWLGIRRREEEERDAAKLLTFLYDRAPGIASTWNANPLCMFPARIRLCSLAIVLPRLVLSMVLIWHPRFENGTRNVRNRIDLSSLFFFSVRKSSKKSV